MRGCTGRACRADLLVHGERTIVIIVSVILEAAVAVVAGGGVGRGEEQMVPLPLIELAARCRIKKAGSVDIRLRKGGEAVFSQRPRHPSLLRGPGPCIHGRALIVVDPGVCIGFRGCFVCLFLSPAAVIEHADGDAMGGAVYGLHLMELILDMVGFDVGKGQGDRLTARGGLEHHAAVLHHELVAVILIFAGIPLFHGGVGLVRLPARQQNAALIIGNVLAHHTVVLGIQDQSRPHVLEDVVPVELTR